MASAAVSRASAQSLYAGALGGYAKSTGKGSGTFEPYGLGLGASAGVTLPVMPIYLGARIVWHAGDTQRLGAGSASVSLKEHYLLYGLDLGYDLALGPLVLRPGLGIGKASLESSSSVSGGGSAVSFSTPNTGSSLYLAPNIGLIIKLGLIYLGGELRYNELTEKAGRNSVSMLASVGLTL